ncbi:uncharacterized protein V1516DRAFT_679522 [Lipomyces oligophaga]|uniref:uncharacterized protein n=1 Tax=Lipomyces oligophaga TaxID=45792 RepID=UPI0034CD37BC
MNKKSVSFASSLAASPDLFARLLPSVYLEKHLTLDPPVRPSLRTPTQFRQCSINTSSLPDTFGSAVVRFGDSIAICGITGFLVDSVDVCSTLYTNIDIAGRTGMPLPQYMAMSQWMFDTVRFLDLYDVSQLNVSGTLKTLVLQAQIQLLSPVESADVAWASLICALIDTKIPKAIVATEEQIMSPDYRPVDYIRFSRSEATPLVLNYSRSSLPWCVNFGVMTNPISLVLADLEGKVEELTVEGKISLIVTASSDDIESISIESGKSEITSQQVKECIKLARSRANELDKTLQRHLEQTSINK